jgi:hypothetical protein
VLFAFLCMGIGCLLRQGLFGKKDDKAAADGETRIASKDRDPKSTPPGHAAGKQSKQPAKDPLVKEQSEQKPRPAEEKRPPAEDTQRRVTFVAHVQPILEARCVRCHGGRKRKGGLDLTTFESLLRGGKSGPAVRPGNLDKSLLWESIETDVMPPGRKLAEAEKKIFKDWILGARNGTLANR